MVCIMCSAERHRHTNIPRPILVRVYDYRILFSGRDLLRNSSVRDTKPHNWRTSAISVESGRRRPGCSEYCRSVNGYNITRPRRPNVRDFAPPSSPRIFAASAGLVIFRVANRVNTSVISSHFVCGNAASAFPTDNLISDPRRSIPLVGLVGFSDSMAKPSDSHMNLTAVKAESTVAPGSAKKQLSTHTHMSTTNRFPKSHSANAAKRPQYPGPFGCQSVVSSTWPRARYRPGGGNLMVANSFFLVVNRGVLVSVSRVGAKGFLRASGLYVLLICHAR